MHSIQQSAISTLNSPIPSLDTYYSCSIQIFPWYTVPTNKFRLQFYLCCPKLNVFGSFDVTYLGQTLLLSVNVIELNEGSGTGWLQVSGAEMRRPSTRRTKMRHFMMSRNTFDDDVDLMCRSHILRSPHFMSFSKTQVCLP